MCVSFRLTGTDPTFFTLPGKKLCDCYCWSGGVVSSQLFALRRSSLAQTLTGSSTPNPFFFSPRLEYYKNRCKRIQFFVLFLGKTKNSRTWWGLDLFNRQDADLTVCGSVFVFIAHPAAHNSLLVDNVFPFFSRFECLCVLFVCDFSVFLASKNVGNPNEYKKKQFLFRSLVVDFQLVQKRRAARHQKKKKVLPPFWLSAGIKWIRSSCNRLKRGEKVAWKHQTAQVHLSLSFLSSYFFFRTHPLVLSFFETLRSLRWMDGWNWWWWWGGSYIDRAAVLFLFFALVRCCHRVYLVES